MWKRCALSTRSLYPWRMGISSLKALLLTLLLLPLTAWASEPLVSPVRRTTVATADPEAALRFWRDTLGFTVEYDQQIMDPGQLGLFAPGARQGRVIALKSGADLAGSIGLLHVPGMKRAGECSPAAAAGDVAVLLLTTDLKAVIARLTAAKVRFLTEPVSYTESRGPTEAVTVFAPDCLRAAIAQLSLPETRP